MNTDEVRELIYTPEGRLDVFTNFLRILNYSVDFEESLALLAGESKTFMQSEAIVLLLIDEHTQNFYYYLSLGLIGLSFKDIVINKKTVFFSRAIKSVVPLYSNDPHKEPFFFPFTDILGDKARSMLFVPLRSRKKTVGSLMYLNKMNGTYDDEDMEFAVFISDFLSISLSSSKLFHENQSKAYEVSALYQMSMARNNSKHLDDILNDNLSVLCEAFEAHRVSIIIKEGKNFVFKCCAGIPKHILEAEVVNVKDNILSLVLETGKPVYSRDVKIDSISNLVRPLRYKSKTFMVCPIFDRSEVMGFICVTERSSDISFKFTDVNLLEMLSQQVSENYRSIVLSKESDIKQKMDNEVSIASNIQQSILPKNFKNKAGVDIYANNIPAKDVGGDFYDFIEIGDGKYVAIMADVSGKGLPAGLFMTMTRSIIKVTFGTTDNPSKALEITNRYVYEDSKTGMFVTCFAAVIDTKNRKITFANAGHGEQYMLSKNANGYDIKIMFKKSKPLGFLDDTKYVNNTIKYRSGDFVVLFTDGVTDTFDLDGLDYGEESIKNLLSVSKFETAFDVYSTMLEDIILFKKDAEQFDDITMMILRLP